MASSLSFLSDDVEEEMPKDALEDADEMPRDAGFHIEVHETNYHFEKRLAVHSYNTVGQLILIIVREIGKP